MPESRTKRTTTVCLPVFLPAVIVAFFIVVGTIANPPLAAAVFAAALAWVTTHFGWFYMLSVAIFLVFIIGVACSSWGRICLGPDHAEPQYSFWSWFAMLFSAGYGIALLFFGVAEPVLHFAAPPYGEAQTLEAAKQAMQIAFFHWGLHIWGIYGLVGLVLAYFAYRHGLPLSMRSALYPLIGDKIYGPAGHVVDIFAILGTLFGIATTLGLSVTQMNAGLHYLNPSIPISVYVQIAAIGLITVLTLGSVIAGLDKGVKRLSVFNMVLVLTLMLFVFMAGPSIFIVEAYLQNTGSYLNNIVERTFNLQAYVRSDWVGNWTLFIFGWTIAWAPFVGLFIARISRGRTIREFVFGVLLAPTLFTFFWFSVFGDTALHMIMREGYDTLVGEVQANTAIALFKLFEQLPMTQLLSGLTVLLIITFFVTSSDSGSLVVASLASGGATNTALWQRIFWATMVGLLAAGLLLAGGLKALQTMTIVSAFPFAIIMLLSIAGLWRALSIESLRDKSLRQHQANGSHPMRWRERISRLVKYPGKVESDLYLQQLVLPSFNAVQERLVEHGWSANVEFDQAKNRVKLSIQKDNLVDFIYEVRQCGYPRPPYALDHTLSDSSYYRAEVFLRRGSQAYDVHGYEQQDLIADVLDQFEKYLHFMHISPDNLPWNTTSP